MNAPEKCCQVGGREDVDDVDAALRRVGEEGAESLSALGRRHGIPKSTLSKHRSVCLGLGPIGGGERPQERSAERSADPGTPAGTQGAGAEEAVARAPDASDPQPVAARARDSGAGSNLDPGGALRGAPPVQLEAADPGDGTSPPLPRAKLADLVDLVRRLPLAQQDAILARSRLLARMRGAMERGLARYPAARNAVALELRGMEI
jgi:hypothetical protein